ncbi:MAG TPA: hypothetical protein PKC43_02600 [Phycisphaerales bacterium]|nr:hypothetical protein [Phycisphaerales bacterium]HMP36316.1 hypothetical protein [Phycisphaerales bacterium]
MSSQPTQCPEVTEAVRGLLRSGDVEQAVHLVLEVYRPALLAYLGASEFASFFRTNGSVSEEDAVQGFLAEKVTRDGFLEQWTSKPNRLRAFLLTAFRYYLLGLRRKELLRAAAPIDVFEEESSRDLEPNASRQFDRRLAGEIVLKAFEATRRRAMQDGKGHYVDLFRRVCLDGCSHAEAKAEREDVTGDMKSIVKTVRLWLAQAIALQIAHPGAPEHEIKEAISTLMESLR